jgi:hypothetical protein
MKKQTFDTNNTNNYPKLLMYILQFLNSLNNKITDLEKPKDSVSNIVFKRGLNNTSLFGSQGEDEEVSLTLPNENGTLATKEWVDNQDFNSDSTEQVDFYEIAVKQLKQSDTLYYSKQNDLIKVLVPISKTLYNYFDFLKDANDDYIKLGEVGYCNKVNDFVYIDRVNGTLTGTFNTASNSSYTTQVGATIALTFTGSAIDFNYYSDNRGGVWNFVLNTGETFSLSTYATIAGVKVTRIFQGLVYGSHTVTATFAGADPSNAPTGGTARGWFTYNASNVLYKTFSLYDYGATLINKVLVLNGASNKEFAITVRRTSTAFAEQWIPQHTTYGTVFGTSLFSVDDVAATSLLNRQVYLPCSNVELYQNMQGKNPSDSVYLANIVTSHFFDKSGLHFNGTIEYTQETTSTNGYVNMIPVNIATFGSNMIDSKGYMYNLTKTDGSNTISPFKDNLNSMCVLDVDNENIIFAMNTNGSDRTYLKNKTNYKTFPNGMTSRFWLQHRDSTLNKFYCQTYSVDTIPVGFIHHINFNMIIAESKKSYTQFKQQLNLVN